MRILHPFTPNYRMETQQHTFQALDVAAADLSSAMPIQIIHAQTPGKTDVYENAIIRNWNQDDLIICEQDIVPTTQDIKSLIECPRHCCVAAHYLYPCSIGGHHPVVAHRIWSGQKIVWCEEGVEWADIVALGLIKISKDLQESVDITKLHQGRWDSIDIRLSDLLRDGMNSSIGSSPFHVHYPIVEHRHWRND